MPNWIKLNFSIANNDYWILIECLDRPVINRWYNSIKKVYDKKSSMIIRKTHSVYADDTHNVTKLYNEVLDAIETLKSLGIEWPVQEPKTFDYTVEWCNQIHRYFTTMSLTGNRMDLKSKQKYNVDTELVSYKTALHTLNTNIHQLELYCSTPQKEKFLSDLKYLTVRPLDFKNKEYYKLYQFEKFEKEDFAHHTWEHYDVVFDEEILGKHILRSFFDNDNPKNIDTTGFSGWYGSFKIYWDKCRQRIYESTEFNDWLGKHNTNKQNLRADFPIGNIVASSHPLDEIISNVSTSVYSCISTLEFIN